MRAKFYMPDSAISLPPDAGDAPGPLTGKAAAQRAARKLCTALGLDGQVEFLGHCGDVPGLLMGHRICVLATHYEGMPLPAAEPAENDPQAAVAGNGASAALLSEGEPAPLPSTPEPATTTPWIS